jgi:hypothetical protein
VRLLPVALLVGCGSYWDLREGALGPPLDCQSLLNYYTDADGDGWGERGSAGDEPAPTPLCAPDVAAQLTATNAMDCDDNDPLVGAKIGNCPVEFASGDPESMLGLEYGGAEYLLALPDNEQVRHTVAGAQCESWSGVLTEGAPEGDRGLAVLSDAAEMKEIQDRIDELQPTGPLEFFVGIRWDDEQGGWFWDNPEQTNAEGATGYCNVTPPELSEFAPFLNLDALEPEVRERFIEQTRLALIRQESGSWCIGVPPVVLEPLAEGEEWDESSSPEYANFICERPSPDPLSYEDVPESRK